MASAAVAIQKQACSPVASTSAMIFECLSGRLCLEPDSRRAIESVVGLRCNSSCRRLSRWDIYNALGVITAANVWRPLSETACPFLIGSR